MDAEELTDLRDYIRHRPGPVGFKPVPHYSATGDMLSVWWEDGPGDDGGYADPINPQLTVIRSMKDNRPIGVKLYGILALVQP